MTSCASGSSISTGWAPAGRPALSPATRFAVIGTVNVDPERGEGRRAGPSAHCLDHPRLQDVMPRRPGGGTENTADWAEPVPEANLRVDYIPACRPALAVGCVGRPFGPKTRRPTRPCRVVGGPPRIIAWFRVDLVFLPVQLTGHAPGPSGLA